MKSGGDLSVLMRRFGRALGTDEAEWRRFLDLLPPPVKRRLKEEFHWQTHGGQEEPLACADGSPWRTWLLMAGRGFGKTRTGAEWVSARAREVPGARIALIGGSRDEVAKVMIEGPSGLLAVARSDETPVWMPTRETLSFSNGAEAFVYSAAAPEKLRGPEHHFAWCDELAKWRHADAAWDNLQMGLRLGSSTGSGQPRAIVTTTPRAVPIVRRVKALQGTVETGGRTDENVHVADTFLRWAAETYGGTRLGRQELEGKLFEEVEGALFSRALLEAVRVKAPLARELRRVVVGVDPPASAGGTCGICVCALGGDGVAYVLDDRSVSGASPSEWARAVARAAQGWGAERVVAEKNQGGDMVEEVLAGASVTLPVRLVSASRGKSARAEPIAIAFEAGRAKLAGRFPELEDELAGLTYAGGYEGPGKSPDRADACVWALSELMKPAAEPRIRLL
jgi:phage terminase large subunit-like protein